MYTQYTQYTLYTLYTQYTKYRRWMYSTFMNECTWPFKTIECTVYRNVEVFIKVLKQYPERGTDGD